MNLKIGASPTGGTCAARGALIEVPTLKYCDGGGSQQTDDFRFYLIIFRFSERKRVEREGAIISAMILTEFRRLATPLWVPNVTLTGTSSLSHAFPFHWVGPCKCRRGATRHTRQVSHGITCPSLPSFAYLLPFIAK
jgi:hypothetical protein